MANNLDRLFREGVDQYEVSPNPQSWEQVQNKLRGKKKKAWMPLSIAAAIILAITGTIVVKNYYTAPLDGKRIAVIDYPVSETKPERIDVPEETVTAHIARKTTRPTPKPIETSQQENLETVSYKMMMVASISEVSLETLPEIKFNNGIEQHVVKQPSVKITYIADNQPTDKKKKFNEFITSISKEASPIEILADIRDAKDNIFSRN